jgi:hypothetical protein
MMKEPFTVVAVETAGIQSYLFNSNRLKENIGASYLVAMATGDWAYDCVTTVTDRHNIDAMGHGIVEDQLIVENQLDAEVLYSGGGNFVALFRTAELARTFVRQLSRKVLLDAPGLTLTFVDAPFIWGETVLSQAVAHLLQGLRQARSEQPLRRGLGGLGVTMMCHSTSLPATTFEQDLEDNWRVYSAEVQAKRRHADAANAYLRDQLELDQLEFEDDDLDYSAFTLSTELDQLGRSKGDTSFIAVVHADGNGLGVLIQGLQDKFPTPDVNRDYIAYMRQFAEKVKQVNREAQHAMFQQVAHSIQISDSDAKQYTICGIDQQTITLRRDKESGRMVFPIRPLVSAGDDVTFVADGRIGLDLAVVFLEAFEAATADRLACELNRINLSKLTACAGVAIVKSHYPFARAYDLADELASSAKQMINHPDYRDESGHLQYSALDWHFTTGGIYDDLDGIREREYRVPSGSLTLRPVLVQVDGHSFRNWTITQALTTGFQQKWRDSRNKAKRLMDALRQGEVEVEVFNLRYLDGDLELPRVADFDQTFGWRERWCGYYDGLELMDLYVPLRRYERKG